MAVERGEVGVVGHPLLFGPAVGDGAFQAIDGFIRLAHLSIDAAHVVEDARLLGFHHQRALGPFQGAFAAVLLGVMTWGACGGGGIRSTGGTPSGSYTITATATSGTVTSSVDVALIVK
jgi:hypothetical protein